MAFMGSVAWDELARGEYIERLPYLPGPTLRRGVQLLLDKSEAMLPFLHDEEWLEEQVENVVGLERIQVLQFVGCPSRGAGAGPVTTWKEYAFPNAGTVILMLTDLGIARPPMSVDKADEKEWLEFAIRAHQAGCPLVAFVPYLRWRWPQRLQAGIHIVPWDHHMTAAGVRHIIGPLHEVRR